jgi:dihydrolipoamide dehydrogenase
MARTYHTFDVVIIGGGSAGLSALREALKYTRNVVLVEKGDGDTTCARTGCMPSKALIHAARLYDSRRKFDEAGIRGSEMLHADIPAILQRVRESRDFFVKSVHEGREDISHYIVKGEASYESPTCLRVDGKLYHTQASVIATGSRPFYPKSFADLPKKRILTSDNLFEQKNLPKRIGFVGLGPLGLEISQALARLGIEVVASHMNANVGGLGNPEISRQMVEVLSQSMVVHSNAEASARMDGDDVLFSVGGQEYPVDAVFLSAGRKPVLDGLGLRRMKAPLRDSGVPWFDPQSLQLSALPIFLAGDANDERAVLHEAVLDGKIAAYNAVYHSDHSKKGKRHHLSRYVPLSIIFTDPNIASVGASWESVQGKGLTLVEASFECQGRALIEQRNEGRIQLFLDSGDATILGAELLAPEGEHMAHLLALAMQQRMTAKELLKMPFYHPAFEEALRTALKRGVKEIVQ